LTGQEHEGNSSPGRAIAWAAALCAAVTLSTLFADVPVARWIDARGGKPPKILYPITDGVSAYGQGFVVVVAAALMLRLDARGRRLAAALVLAVVVAAVAANVLKMATSRARPHEFLQTGVMWAPWEGFRHSRYNSLPSAHAAAAFAFSAVMAAAYPRAAAVFATLAVLCGVNRVATLQHYISDTVAGAALGWWVGAGMMRWQWANRLAARCDNRRSDAADG
jgi:membrane-associated phospholipid phosphatase